MNNKGYKGYKKSYSGCGLLGRSSGHSRRKQSASYSGKRRKSISPERKICPDKFILREGYYRRGRRKSKRSKRRSKGSYIPPSCIAIGKKSKKTNKYKTEVPKLLKETLSQFGYSTAKSDSSRRKALSLAIENMSGINVYKKLNALMKLNRFHPDMYDLFKIDRDWIEFMYLK